MNVLDLFSGIGGFALGFERAGMRTVAFCEIDPYCRAVLAAHWPGVPIHDDIRRLDAGAYAGTVDVVCGGWPCQPVSVAGKRRGADDDRYLWPQMLRVIREVQPSYVVGENVFGIVGLELDNVLSDLEALGYACGTFDIPACAIGAAHRRQRVWILAHANERRREVERQPQHGIGCEAGDESDGLGEGRWWNREIATDTEGNGSPHRDTGSLWDGRTSRELERRNGEAAADTDSSSVRSEQGWLEPGRTGTTESGDDGETRIDPDTGRELLEGWRRESTQVAVERSAESGVCRGVDGIPRTMDRDFSRDFARAWEVPTLVEGRQRDRVARLRALGNSVVVPMAEVIGRAIMGTLE